MYIRIIVFCVSLSIFVVPNLFSSESIPYKFQVIKEDQSGIHFSLNFDLFLNRHYVGEGKWYGPEKYLYEAEINDAGGSILNITEEQHTITIGNRSLEELDIILFNWMELEFPQAYEAKDNYLIFSRPKNDATNFFQFRLKKFTSPDRFRLAKPIIDDCR